MPRIAKAVVCRELNRNVRVEEIGVDSPHRDEVMVKITACGVCHSDLSATNGTIGFPLPLVLGHEGAGIVVEVGEGVDEFAVGDHVMASFVNMCGKCRYCSAGRPVLCDNASKALSTLPDGTLRTRDAEGDALNIFSGCGVMAEYATMHVGNLVKVKKEIPFAAAALVSCGVMTGVGAVFNTARLEPGSFAVVFGAGGVGLSAIQGCRIAGAAMIIAVDTMDSKLELAKEFGATHTLNPNTETDIVKSLKRLTHGGPDYGFECIGLSETVSQTYRAIRKGGKAIVVGVARPADTCSIRTMTLPFEEKVLTGSMYGSTRPREDFPKLLSLYQAGQLKLDELITAEYTIDQAPQAFADLVAGKNARGMIRFDA